MIQVDDCGCGLRYVVPTDTTTECINPLIYLLEPALISCNGDLNALNSSIQTILNEGLYLQNKNSLCCPDCVGDNSFYFFGNTASFTTFIQGYSSSNNFSSTLDCCTNYVGDLTSSLDLKNLLNNTFINEITCCSNNFLDNFLNYVSKDSIVASLRDAGLIEISTFNNDSFLTLLKAKVLELYPYADDAFLSSVLTSILTSGVFIKCIDCGILITNATNAGTALNNFV